jgi:hypothetical protein
LLVALYLNPSKLVKEKEGKGKGKGKNRREINGKVIFNIPYPIDISNN